MTKKGSFITKKNYDEKAERAYMLVMQQDWKALQELLQEGGPCDYQSAWGRTALHAALFQNHIHSAPPGLFEQLVVASKEVINLGTDSNNTALHWAVLFATLEEVEILLHNGADPTLKNKDGLTPLDLAMEKRNTNIIHALKTILK